MACTAGTYTITTTNSHVPSWSGTLTINPDGTATFQVAGNSVPVNVQCGTDALGNWIQFTNTHAHPAVHYQKAHRLLGSSEYKGPCDNNDGIANVTDDWTATTSPFPPPGTKVQVKRPAAKKTAAKKAPSKKAAKKAAPKKAVKKAGKKTAPKKAAKKAAKKGAAKKPARGSAKKRR